MIWCGRQELNLWRPHSIPFAIRLLAPIRQKLANWFYSFLCLPMIYFYIVYDYFLTRIFTRVPTILFSCSAYWNILSIVADNLATVQGRVYEDLRVVLNSVFKCALANGLISNNPMLLIPFTQRRKLRIKKSGQNRLAFLILPAGSPWEKSIFSLPARHAFSQNLFIEFLLWNFPKNPWLFVLCTL